MLKVISHIILGIALVSTSMASSSEPKKVQEDDSQELSLKQDRKELEELRSQVPEEVQRENDDMAFILKLFDDKKRSPSKIRSQFNKVFNRARKKKQKEFKKERDAFSKNEKSIRNQYVEVAKEKRKKFLASGANKEAKRQFFIDERAERKSFFSDQKEKRNDFEADMKAKRKEFDDFMKDRRKDFDDRYQQFIKDQKELKKMEASLKKQRSQASGSETSQTISTQDQKYLEDFKKIPKRGGSRLAPPEEK